MFAAYNAATIQIFDGLPESISRSYYILNEKRYGLGYAFTIWAYATAIVFAVLMFELSDGRWFQFLGLFAAGGLAFVGAAPNFLTHEKVVHYVSAGVCAIASVMWIGLMGHLAPSLIWIAAGVVAGLIYSYSWLWFVEVALFVVMYLVVWAELVFQ